MHEHGFVAFGQWGDGWGPLCLDVTQPRADGDCPIVWLDHELLWNGEPMSRARLEVLARPVYESFRAFVEDVFRAGR
jgi:hypothetical protein